MESAVSANKNSWILQRELHRQGLEQVQWLLNANAHKTEKRATHLTKGIYNHEEDATGRFDTFSPVTLHLVVQFEFNLNYLMLQKHM